MATIKKPDANPVAAALLCLIYGLGHMVINGQTRKFVMTLIASILGLCACLVGSPIISIFSIIDAYQTALRLKAGEEIGENEYSLPILYKIIKIIDKTATCPAADKPA